MFHLNLLSFKVNIVPFNLAYISTPVDMIVFTEQHECDAWDFKRC